MLQSLREGSKSWVMKGLLGFLALTFVAFFGVSGNIGTGSIGNPNTLIEIGSSDYGQNEIIQRYNQMSNIYAQQLGSTANFGPDLQRQILNQAIGGLVVEGLFTEAAGNLRLVVSNEQIARQIRAEPGFQAGGQFNRIAFTNYLLQTGQSEAQLAASIRQRILVEEQFFGSFLAGVAVPNAVADRLYRYRAETRSAEMVFVDASSQGNVGTAARAELDQYYADHRQEFTIPDMRRATILWVTVDELAAATQVSEADIAAAYEERSHEFVVPEKRRMEQAIFASQAAAQEISEMVAGGIEFAAAVTSVQGAPPSDLGTVQQDMLLADQAAPAFAAEVGGVTPPFETALGWHLIHVISAQDGTIPPLEEIRDTLRDTLAREDAEIALFDYADLVDDALAGGRPLDEVAEGVGLPVLTIGPIAGDGSGADGERTADLLPDPAVLTQIFAVEPGQTGLMQEISDNGFFFVQVDEAIAPRTPSLDEIETRVQDAWRAAQQLERARATAERVAERLGDGATDAQISRDFNLETISPDPFTRSGAAAGLPPDLVSGIFAAEVGDIVSADLSGGILVARVALIEVPSGEGEDDTRAELVDELRASMMQDLQGQLATALREKIDVAVDNQAIDELLFRQ